ncbi:MAG: DedA family protein [Candidatus Magasanikbacteria bacterium]|nr:DedA family protein [Candidatus Magasanikbacteria bacterium]
MFLQLTSYITTFIQTVGYPGLAAMMALEAIIAPIPSELIVPFAGFLISDGQFTWLGVLIATTIGSLAGAYFLYALGRYGGRPLIAKWGHWVLVKPEDVAKTEEFFGKHGRKAILISKFIPIIRSYISLPAGLSKMPLGPFFLYSAIGSLIWNSFLVYLGFTLKNNWAAAAEKISSYETVGKYLVVIIVVAWIVRHFYVSKRKQSPN